jgi:hypothetical protein
MRILLWFECERAAFDFMPDGDERKHSDADGRKPRGTA